MIMIQDVLREKYEDCLESLDIYENANSLILSKIVINENCRNEGIGTKVMNDLINYADKNNQIVALTPSKDFGGSVNRLIQFYKRFGFKMNKGANKNFEFRDTMLRYPIQKGQKRINEGNGVMIKMVKKLIVNSRQTLEEIKKESYETYLLIQKHISGNPLTKEEKGKLLSNLKDILTKLGYGAIFMLPGGTVLLLILNIFNNKIKKKKADMINEDKLKGGKADKLTKKDIANKFGVTVAKINKELDMGVEIELEHTNSRRLAKEIAMDHLTEIPDYYTRLKKMEKEGKSKWKKREKKLDETTKEFIRGLVRLNLND